MKTKIVAYDDTGRAFAYDEREGEVSVALAASVAKYWSARKEEPLGSFSVSEKGSRLALHYTPDGGFIREAWARK